MFKVFLIMCVFGSVAFSNDYARSNAKSIIVNDLFVTKNPNGTNGTVFVSDHAYYIENVYRVVEENNWIKLIGKFGSKAIQKRHFISFEPEDVKIKAGTWGVVYN